MTKISLQDFFKIAAILLSLGATSCVRNDDNTTSYRIVGLNGESRQMQTKVPELNARILESQGRQLPPQTQGQEFAQTQQAQPPVAPSQNLTPEANRALQETMQADQGKPSYNVPKNDVAQNTLQAEDKTSVGAADKDSEIQYDLSDAEKPTKKSAKKMKLKTGKSTPVKAESDEEEEEAPVATKGKKKFIFVQTGSFSTEENAKQDLSKVQKFYKGKIEEADIGDKKTYRVLLGPVANDKKAKDLVHKVKSSGHDAIVVKK